MPLIKDVNTAEITNIVTDRLLNMSDTEVFNDENQQETTSNVNDFCRI